MCLEWHKELCKPFWLIFIHVFVDTQKWFSPILSSLWHPKLSHFLISLTLIFWPTWSPFNQNIDHLRNNSKSFQNHHRSFRHCYVLQCLIKIHQFMSFVLGIWSFNQLILGIVTSIGTLSIFINTCHVSLTYHNFSSIQSMTLVSPLLNKQILI